MNHDEDLFAALKKHGPRDEPLSEDHYINMWSRGFFQTAMAVLVGLVVAPIVLSLTLSTIWFYIEPSRSFVSKIADDDLGETSLIVFFILLFSWGVYQFSYKRLFVEFPHYSYEIVLGQEWMMGRGIWGQMKRIRYDDLEAITQPVSFLGLVASDMIFRSRSNPIYYIRVNAALFGFGQMVERVIQKCNEAGTEYDVVHVNALALNPTVWQKEPDWELITNAVERANENAKRHGIATYGNATSSGDGSQAEMADSSGTGE